MIYPQFLPSHAYGQVLPVIAIVGGIVWIGLFPSGDVIGGGLTAIGIVIMLVIYEVIMIVLGFNETLNHQARLKVVSYCFTSIKFSDNQTACMV